MHYRNHEPPSKQFDEEVILNRDSIHEPEPRQEEENSPRQGLLYEYALRESLALVESS
ncbi:hypothetical protein JCM14467A_09210 [Vulcanisaeta sp. JCM 14467]